MTSNIHPAPRGTINGVTINGGCFAGDPRRIAELTYGERMELQRAYVISDEYRASVARGHGQDV